LLVFCFCKAHRTCRRGLERLVCAFECKAPSGLGNSGLLTHHVPAVVLSLPCCCGGFSATHLCTLPGTRALPKSVVTPPRAQDEEDLDFVDWRVEIERPVERGALALGSAHSVHGVLCVQSMVCEHSRGL
jgi:hypothetical protein